MRARARVIDLEEYRAAIALDEPLSDRLSAPLGATRLTEIVEELVAFARSESPGLTAPDPDAASYESKRRYLRAFFTLREPGALPDRIARSLDALLQSETLKRAPFDPFDRRTDGAGAARTTFFLWRGDITRLKVDAILNAANRELLGCFQPFHGCVDNAIHCAAGPALRADCATIMKLQGTAEPTGGAKITRAYNLPSRYALHTVGPIAPRARADSESETLLSRSYIAALDLAARMPTISSIGFCCVSTGMFGFPSEQAARIVLSTTRGWVDRNPDRFEAIVFTLFSESDFDLYRRLAPEHEVISG